MEKKKTWKILLIVVAIVLLIAGVSYAYWTHQTNQKTINKVSSNCLKIEMTESNAIDLNNAYPLTDEQASDLTPYTFTLTNTCNLPAKYQVNMEVMDVANRLGSQFISLQLNNGTKQFLNSFETSTPVYNETDYTPVESYKIKEGHLSAGQSVTYNVRMWMDESVTVEDDVMNKNFISKVTIESVVEELATAYTEDILNGADPVLGEGLIPVNIANDGTVTKANTEEMWYNYSNQVWANAVILEDENIEYNNYDVIPESNIESYFVWIPRYKYKIWDEGKYNSLTSVDESKPHTIQVEFETTETPVSEGSTVGSWLTHPAFISFNINGIWVGKFESGYKGAKTTAEAQKNESDSTKLQIKPNVYSWRSIQPSKSHLVSYNYQRNLDSHMMKNTEWGAVAYLQHSTYGSRASVRINNNSAYITGYAAKNEPTIGYTATNEEGNRYEGTAIGKNGANTFMYNTMTGYLASTTGNITGVYDMSGGAWKYMMGVLADQNGKPMSGRSNSYNSGFTGKLGCPTCDSNDGSVTEIDGVAWPESKYYDLYPYGTSSQTYGNKILGDATGEMGPFASKTYLTQTRQISSWYADDAFFVSSTAPWFQRGGAYYNGTGAGVFTFGNDNGRAWGSYSFRVVLAV